MLDQSLRGKFGLHNPEVNLFAQFPVETFGFQHLLWVYSGRRGIHCWISDPSALDLNDDQRRSLVTFLEVIKGSKEQMKKVNVRGPKGDGDLHPYLE